VRHEENGRKWVTHEKSVQNKKGNLGKIVKNAELPFFKFSILHNSSLLNCRLYSFLKTC